MKEPPNKKGPTRLAIGTEDGFSADAKDFQVEELTSLVILPDWDEVDLPNPDLPEIVQVTNRDLISIVCDFCLAVQSRMMCLLPMSL